MFVTAVSDPLDLVTQDDRERKDFLLGASDPDAFLPVTDVILIQLRQSLSASLLMARRPIKTDL